jgi:hypothetical protein
VKLLRFDPETKVFAGYLPAGILDEGQNNRVFVPCIPRRVFGYHHDWFGYRIHWQDVTLRGRGYRLSPTERSLFKLPDMERHGTLASLNRFYRRIRLLRTPIEEFLFWAVLHAVSRGYQGRLMIHSGWSMPHAKRPIPHSASPPRELLFAEGAPDFWLERESLEDPNTTSDSGSDSGSHDAPTSAHEAGEARPSPSLKFGQNQPFLFIEPRDEPEGAWWVLSSGEPAADWLVTARDPAPNIPLDPAPNIPLVRAMRAARAAGVPSRDNPNSYLVDRFGQVIKVRQGRKQHGHKTYRRTTWSQEALDQINNNK